MLNKIFFNQKVLSVAIQSILGLSLFSSMAYAEDTQPEKLATITVTASQTEHDQKSAPATISVITQEDLAK